MVKARNKLDGRIYAIKKIKLKGTENDDKIFREINYLSRLNHRYIVRYFATWLETVHRKRSGSVSGWDSGDESTDSDMTASHQKPTSTPSETEEDMLQFNLDDLAVKSRSGKSFPSIHFGEESSSRSTQDDEDDESSDDESADEGFTTESEVARPISRILYIQMVKQSLCL